MKLPFFGDRDLPASEETPIPIPAAPPGATVVLMVDDEPAQRQLFAHALRREGYYVVEARNGAEGLDLIAQVGRLDLVVSDIVMPVMKGPEMVARLRDRFPALPVVFVSGFVVIEEVGGNAHVLQKPFARQDLLKCVADLIGPPKGDLSV